MGVSGLRLLSHRSLRSFCLLAFFNFFPSLYLDPWLVSASLHSVVQPMYFSWAETKQWVSVCQLSSTCPFPPNFFFLKNNLIFSWDCLPFRLSTLEWSPRCVLLGSIDGTFVTVCSSSAREGPLVFLPCSLPAALSFRLDVQSIVSWLCEVLRSVSGLLLLLFAYARSVFQCHVLNRWSFSHWTACVLFCGALFLGSLVFCQYHAVLIYCSSIVNPQVRSVTLPVVVLVSSFTKAIDYDSMSLIDIIIY